MGTMGQNIVWELRGGEGIYRRIGGGEHTKMLLATPEHHLPAVPNKPLITRTMEEMNNQ